jgi:UDP-2,3-diacylglucosamine pyrophosphatase LpxH
LVAVGVPEAQGQYIGSFADALADEARRRDLDGVVCGHIHHAEIREVGGVTYCNDGDWVESCTALVEHFNGRLAIVNWVEQRRLLDLLEAPAASARPLIGVEA